MRKSGGWGKREGVGGGGSIIKKKQIIRKRGGGGGGTDESGCGDVSIDIRKIVRNGVCQMR